MSIKIDTETIAAALAELGYRLEHMYPNDVREWAPDEAAAYRDYGGFQEGRNAVYALRITKLAEMLESVIRERDDALQARLDKVRVMHKPRPLRPTGTAWMVGATEECRACGSEYPCPTIQAIDGSDQ